MSYYRQQLESFLEGLPINCDTVYDVGGKEKPIKGRTRSWNVNNYQILDLPDFDLEKPLRRGGVVHADIIFCLEVFEYLTEPVIALKNINRLLEKDGIAYISVPLVYPVHNDVEFDSLRYTENGFKKLCKKAKLVAEVVQYRRDAGESLQRFYMADGMRAAKGIDHSIYGYIFKVRKNNK